MQNIEKTIVSSLFCLVRCPESKNFGSVFNGGNRQGGEGFLNFYLKIEIREVIFKFWEKVEWIVINCCKLL